jgi:mannosyltransferase
MAQLQKENTKVKIIYDDIIYSLQCAGGISLYWSQLETYLEQDIHLLYTGYEKNIFLPALKDKKIIKNNKAYILFERYKNVKISEKKQFIFHSSYYRYCKSKTAINITTIHDFTYEYFRNDIKSNIHKIQKKNTIENSKALICNSENTKKDLLLFYPNYNGIIKVIYMGLSEDYYFNNSARKNIVIFIGSRACYKNFEYAVKLVHELSDLKLQIIGGGELKGQEISLLKKYLPNRYEYYRYLKNEELNIKYNEAKFLLYPSLYEGFGFPVIEAQAAGCPVVCCNVSSLTEVAGDAAVYISGKDISNDLYKISSLDDRDYYCHLVEKGLGNCRRFSWEKCAQQTYEFYQEIWTKQGCL